MPPRPFPFPINVGTDICSVQRIIRILGDAKYRSRFPKRILTPKELKSRWLPLVDTLEAWKHLQTQRRDLGLEKKAYSPNNYFYHQDRQKRLTQSGDDNFLPDFLSQRPFPNATAKSVEKDAKVVIAEEGPTTTTFERVATDTEDTDSTHPETRALSNENAEASVSEESTENVSTRVASKADACVFGGSDGSEDAEHSRTTVASGTGADEEPSTTRGGEKQEEDVVSTSKEAELLDRKYENILPEVWKVAQFLAGR
jgi:hypothetical protein